MSGEKIAVSIVLPCLNEAVTVGACVDRAMEALAAIFETYGLRGEVLIADNGSTDGSQEIALARGARVVDIPRRGYGAALIGGFKSAQGEYLIMGDSDLSYDFVEAVPMIGHLVDGSDLCMGSRFKGAILPGAMPWKNKYIGNPALSWVLRTLFQSRVSDAHCGLRALTRSAFERLRLGASGMEFASEMVLKASLLDLNVAESPVTLAPDQRGRPPHLNPWRDGLRHLIYMLMLSPTWLFFAPAITMGSIGLILFIILLTHSSDTVVNIGPVFFGTHWIVVASAMIIISVQLCSFGLAALQHGYREGYRLPTPRITRILGASRLRVWLLGGGILVLGGLIGVLAVATGWVSSGFGPLSAIRELIVLFTCITVGFEVIFGGFLLSIISGNTSDHAVKRDPPVPDRTSIAQD